MANPKKKTSTGRPNFEPRYGEKKSSYQDRKRFAGAPAAGSDTTGGSGRSGGSNGSKAGWAKSAPARNGGAKAGSRSPGHRGHRADEEGTAPKARWNASQRAGRDESRGIRDHAPRPDSRGARSYDDRPRRDDRPARSFDERPARRDDRPARSFDERPARRDDRPARSFDELPARRNDRPARHDDRPVRRDDRPARSWDDKARTASTHRDAVDVVHERLQAQAIQAGEASETSWSDLGLGQNIAGVLVDLGAPSPFPIQAATIPEVLAGRDMLARGRTGSGKTIAFGAPLVERVLRSQGGGRREYGRRPRALILAPTRELALQIDGTVQPIARSVGLFTTQVYGGVPQGRQIGALRKGVDIVIGTPGRIEDLIDQRKLDLSDVRVVVIDEADHMSELGFLEPLQRILRHTPGGSQKLLFSATLDREVAAVVDEFLENPAVYEVAGETQETGTIDHRVLVIDHREKGEILRRLVDRDGKTLVFARTRAYAEMLADDLADAGIPAVALHGDLNQAKRTRNLERLTSGRVRVLVATDVAARGIHVDDIDLVVQADAPDEYKTYLHRSGRTGRAGAMGRVVTLIPRQRRRRMTEMLERAEIDAPFEEARAGDDVIDELAGTLPTDAELTR